MLNALRITGVCAVLMAGLITSASAHGPVDLDLKHHVRYGPADDLDFAIEAPAVKGLYPGAEKPMKLTISNPFPYDIKITSLSGTLRSTSRSACVPSTSNLQVRPRTG